MSHASDRGRNSRGRGGRGGGRPQGRDEQVSKAMSKILRHDAEKLGLKLDDGGYASVEDLLNLPRMKSLQATFAEIQAVTATNAKQRFSIRENPQYIPQPATPAPDAAAPLLPQIPPDAAPAHYLIRANQGHSIALDAAAHLTPISLAADNVPPTVVHGTYFGLYNAILAAGGLKPMGRNHVHFGTGLPPSFRKDAATSDTPAADSSAPDVISGMRNDAELLIWVDVRQNLAAQASGADAPPLDWWLSDNNVVLTAGDAARDQLVSTAVWQRVEGRPGSGVGVLWEHGAAVAPLPDWAARRAVPQGKRAVVERVRADEKRRAREEEKAAKRLRDMEMRQRARGEAA